MAPVAADMPPTAPELVESFSESFMDAERVYFQIMRFGEATYLWIGSGEARQDVLAYGVPGVQGSAHPATGRSLIGGQGGDMASETMSKRLAQKLGHPVFVSISLKDDAELRGWAERQALAALVKGRGAGANTAPTEISDITVDAASASASIASSAGGSNPLPSLMANASAAGAAAAAGRGVGARTYEVFESTDKLGEAATALLLASARESIAARGKFVIALSGGSIPKIRACMPADIAHAC